jgi:hypothetical protein
MISAMAMLSKRNRRAWSRGVGRTNKEAVDTRFFQAMQRL